MREETKPNEPVPEDILEEALRITGAERNVHRRQREALHPAADYRCLHGRR